MQLMEGPVALPLDLSQWLARFAKVPVDLASPPCTGRAVEDSVLSVLALSDAERMGCMRSLSYVAFGRLRPPNRANPMAPGTYQEVGLRDAYIDVLLSG